MLLPLQLQHKYCADAAAALQLEVIAAAAGAAQPLQRFATAAAQSLLCIAAAAAAVHSLNDVQLQHDSFST